MRKHDVDSKLKLRPTLRKKSPPHLASYIKLPVPPPPHPRPVPHVNWNTVAVRPELHALPNQTSLNTFWAFMTTLITIWAAGRLIASSNLRIRPIPGWSRRRGLLMILGTWTRPQDRMVQQPPRPPHALATSPNPPPPPSPHPNSIVPIPRPTLTMSRQPMANLKTKRRRF